MDRNFLSLIVGLGLMLTGLATAQTFTTLHSFTGGNDGRYPVAELILSGNTLYGTTGGADYISSTVFKVNTGGTGFTNVHRFTGNRSDSGLILSGNTLYGTASDWANGFHTHGIVFKVNTDGTAFTNLHIFTAQAPNTGSNTDGAFPIASLILSGNTLYGTARNGGSAGYGTVFKVNTDGSGFTTLHSFTAPSGSPSTNSDGCLPTASLVLSGDTLYGTAGNGGSAGYGTVFKVNTDGSGFTNLHSFARVSDGAGPGDRLILIGNILYGVASDGGNINTGTIFALNTNGTGFTILHRFAGGNYNSSGYYTNSEGI